MSPPKDVEFSANLMIASDRFLAAEHVSAPNHDTSHSPVRAGEDRIGFYFHELKDTPHKQWLAEGLIGKGDLVVLTGEPNVGKTFVALWLAAHLLRGDGAVGGRFPIKSVAKVAYACGEKWGGFVARCRAALADAEVTPGQNLVVFKDVPQLFRDTDGAVTQDRFEDELRDLMPQGVDLLIVDTLSAATLGMDENAAGDMKSVVHATKGLRDRLGCAVLLLHHPAKGRKTGLRGSGVLEGAADAIINVAATDQGQARITLFCGKQGDAENFRPLRLRLDPAQDSLVVREDDQPVREPSSELNVEQRALTVLRDRGRPMSSKEISDAIGVTHDAVRMALNRSREGYLVKERPQRGRATLFRWRPNTNANP